MFRNNPYSVTHIRKNSTIIFSERYLFGLEVKKILNNFFPHLPVIIIKQLQETCKWCSNVFYNEIFNLSRVERIQFYQLCKQNHNEIKQLYSYMSWKNKIIFKYGINYFIWNILTKFFF
jgi:hypothetical protein